MKKKALLKWSLIVTLIVAICFTAIARKKSELGSVSCTPLIKDKPETSTDESKNGPCSCTDVDGNVWRCDKCDDASTDCGDGPIYQPPSRFEGVVIVNFPEGIKVFDTRKPGHVIDDLSTIADKSFVLDFGKDKNNNKIPVWIETAKVKGASSMNTPLIVALAIVTIALIASIATRSRKTKES